MTWKHGLIAGGVVVAIFIAAKFSSAKNEALVADLASVCEAQNGAWIYNSDIPLCMTADRGLLVYDRAAGEFVASADQDEVQSDRNDEAYSNTPVSGSVTEPDFSTYPNAIKYKTAITKDFKQGPNFAQFYVASTWGCGTKRNSCVGNAIVDIRDGRILMYGTQTQSTPEFDLDHNTWRGINHSGRTVTFTIDENGKISSKESS